jgi:hypothetical protein
MDICRITSYNRGNRRYRVSLVTHIGDRVARRNLLKNIYQILNFLSFSIYN